MKLLWLHSDICFLKIALFSVIFIVRCSFKYKEAWWRDFVCILSHKVNCRATWPNRCYTFYGLFQSKNLLHTFLWILWSPHHSECMTPQLFKCLPILWLNRPSFSGNPLNWQQYTPTLTLVQDDSLLPFP